MDLTDYSFEKKVEKGSFGSIYLVRRKEDDEEFAIKKQDVDEYGFAGNEAEIMAKLRHPNVLALYKSWVKDEESYILIEYASGGTLYDLIVRASEESRVAMDESEALLLLSQLALGVEHMHSRQVMHRDLKPENVMFAGPKRAVKIIDFGLSRDVSSDSEVCVVNPNSYSAPECWSELPHTFKSDVWSLGALLYEVATGDDPKNVQEDIGCLDELTGLVEVVCRKILQSEPDDRPHCRELVRCGELKESMHRYLESLDAADEREIVEEQLKSAIDKCNFNSSDSNSLPSDESE